MSHGTERNFGIRSSYLSLPHPLNMPEQVPVTSHKREVFIGEASLLYQLVYCGRYLARVAGFFSGVCPNISSGLNVVKANSGI